MIVRIMEAEIAKDEGLKDRQKIFGGVKIFLFCDLLITLGVVRTQPILI